ncbi:MAG: UrcA family protein [Steroidobacteraceae bacterium]
MNSRKTGRVRITSSKITMAMIACGIVGAAFIGAANAATPDDDVARVTVRYNPQSLETESGARALYSQLVKAAAEACPQGPDSPHWITQQVRECRAQALARAVFQVNNPRLAALYASSARSS